MAEKVSDPPPCGFNGSFLGFSQEPFELDENLLDGIEVGRIRRQEEEFCAGVSDGVSTTPGAAQSLSASKAPTK